MFEISSLYGYRVRGNKRTEMVINTDVDNEVESNAFSIQDTPSAKLTPSCCVPEFPHQYTCALFLICMEDNFSREEEADTRRFMRSFHQGGSNQDKEQTQVLQKHRIMFSAVICLFSTSSYFSV